MRSDPATSAVVEAAQGVCPDCHGSPHHPGHRPGYRVVGMLAYRRHDSGALAAVAHTRGATTISLDVDAANGWSACGWWWSNRDAALAHYQALAQTEGKPWHHGSHGSAKN